MIRKSFAAVETKVLDEAQGICEALVNCTGIVDLQGDVMMVGCFDGVIKAAKDGSGKYPVICRDHDWGKKVGKVTDMEELRPGDAHLAQKGLDPNAGALRVVMQYNMGKQEGREAASDVGFLKDQLEWSVGFLPDEAAVSYEKGIRRIANVKRLAEISDVLMGASPGTLTTAVKAAESEDRKERTQDRLAKGKSILAENKDGRLPELQGDEAAHNEPLKTALAAVERLISQEVAEDEPEYDCVIRLACIGQQLLDWAAGEALGDGGYADAPLAMPAYLAAGIAVLHKTQEEPPPVSLPDWFAASMHAAAEQALAEAREAQLTPIPPPHVPAHSDGHDGLTHWARARARPRFGG